MTESKKRVRRTPEQRIADLEKKQAAILERQKAAMARIEAAKIEYVDIMSNDLNPAHTFFP